MMMIIILEMFAYVSTLLVFYFIYTKIKACFSSISRVLKCSWLSWKCLHQSICQTVTMPAILHGVAQTKPHTLINTPFTPLVPSFACGKGSPRRPPYYPAACISTYAHKNPLAFTPGKKKRDSSALHTFRYLKWKRKTKRISA